MRSCKFESSLKFGDQTVVLVLTIQMFALLLCSVKNSYFRHCMLLVSYMEYIFVSLVHSYIQ